MFSSKNAGRVSLAQICQSSTPHCRLNPLLFNGHLQTCWTQVKTERDLIYYKRKVFEAEDRRFEGSFTVDFVAEPFDRRDDSLPPRTVYFDDDEFAGFGSLDSRPMLIVLHGLSGGSNELYLRQALAPLVTAESGWAACVINSRGCAQSQVKRGRLYNARSTWDTRQLVKWCRQTFPNRPLFAVGFSLGANILTNYIGEEGSACELKAAFACSNPWNLEVGSAALQRTWMGRFYSAVMASNMKRLVETHKDQILATSDVDMQRLRKTRYMYEFDSEIQCPTWGYPTVGAYYRDSSSVDSLLNVRIPFFAVNAEDDPIATRESIPYDEFRRNPYTVLCTTSTGGHLGWFELGGGRWYVKAIASFLRQMARHFEGDDEGALQEPTASTTTTNATGSSAIPYDFKPMRRKMHMQESVA